MSIVFSICKLVGLLIITLCTHIETLTERTTTRVAVETNLYRDFARN